MYQLQRQSDEVMSIAWEGESPDFELKLNKAGGVDLILVRTCNRVYIPPDVVDLVVSGLTQFRAQHRVRLANAEIEKARPPEIVVTWSLALTKQEVADNCRVIKD